MYCVPGQRPVYPYPPNQKSLRNIRRSSASQCGSTAAHPETEYRHLTQTVFTSVNSIPDQVCMEQINEQFKELDCFKDETSSSSSAKSVTRQGELSIRAKVSLNQGISVANML